uniref:Uncharacterized protein n=1 Tax=Rhipicephalus zambeziensis TaxID=60191 RepID=A0A224YLU7_9ACAR
MGGNVSFSREHPYVVCSSPVLYRTSAALFSTIPIQTIPSQTHSECSNTAVVASRKENNGNLNFLSSDKAVHLKSPKPVTRTSLQVRFRQTFHSQLTLSDRRDS